MKNDYIESIVNKIPVSKQVEIYNKLDNWEWFEELPEDEPNYYVPNSVRGYFIYFLQKAISRNFSGKRKPNSPFPVLWSDIVEEKVGGYTDRYSRYSVFMNTYRNKSAEDLTQKDLINMLNKLDEINGEYK